MAQSTHTVSGDFDLTMEELRAVARYVVWHAEDVLAVFERAVPDDSRPRAAIDAAWSFINGADRTRLQRMTSVEAHRAARSAPSEAARLAARAAGDAASAAYLHPISQASQVGHILRASSSVARIAELQAGGDPAKSDALLERSRQRATPVLIDVLRRYPPAAGGSDRVARLMCNLDRSLRQGQGQGAGAGGHRPPSHTTESRARVPEKERDVWRSGHRGLWH
ncbi:putative immunity protein [Streptomyces sp. NPDC020412]|uniref:putative immunity protein n=1 Tax=Streptomyces sp. NPDC020412 TaxID=3365073 RepID=UPI00378B5320